MASDHNSDEQLPVDPLLKSGAFIDVNRSTEDTETTPVKPTGDATEDATKEATEDAAKDATSSSPTSEDAQATPISSSVPTYVTPVSQWRPDAPTPPESSSERPSWVPEGWNVERRVRTSGATAGTVDRYYISPGGKKFRSKTEVMNFISTGDKRKRTLDEKAESGSVSDPAASGAGSSKKKEKKEKKEKPEKPEKKANRGGGRKKQKQSENGKDFSNLAFDFKNPPQAATWVPKDESNNEWTAVVGNAVVPEAEQGQWSNVQERVTELEKGAEGEGEGGGAAAV